MANIDENVERWNKTYDWQGAGDEWSADFGGTEALWFFILYPRIHRFIPSPTILEIAPGFGRWTQFLKGQCRSMIAVDISQKCIESCKERFASDRNIQFHVNDGKSLAAVPDNSIDFVFSFDSLVHVEKDVMEAYMLQLGRKLTPDGVGFIHHSNLGAYPGRSSLVNYYKRLPSSLQRANWQAREPLTGVTSSSIDIGLVREWVHTADPLWSANYGGLLSCAE